jgi:Bardet-Biedl syndrome 9 protein
MATVMGSKDDMKIRVQGDNPNALQLVLSETYARYTSPALDYTLSSSERIPSEDLFFQIERHFTWRQEIKNVRKTLEDRTYQFRII